MIREEPAMSYDDFVLWVSEFGVSDLLNHLPSHRVELSQLPVLLLGIQN